MNSIINLGFFAHVDAGKTTLTEQILYISGEIKQPGSVNNGNTQTDTMEIERKRGISIKASMTQTFFKNNTINIIDTPGHTDFLGEVQRTLPIIDNSILVLSAVEGIEAQTRVIWDVLKDTKIPTLFFINKIDRAGANENKVIKEIEDEFKIHLVDIEKLSNIEYFAEQLSYSDEELLKKIIEEKEEITWNELVLKFKNQFLEKKIYPYIKGEAINGINVKNLLEFISEYFKKANINNDKEISALVYKIEHTKKMGKIAYIRMYGGSIKVKELIKNTTKKSECKISMMKKNKGIKLVDCSEINNGEIGILCGTNFSVGDILGNSDLIPNINEIVTPLLKTKIESKDKNKFQDLLLAIQELVEEDPLLSMEYIRETKDILINITGVIQLEILENILLDNYKINVEFSKPLVIYKETIIKEGYGHERYTMPKPCWADIKIRLTPLGLGEGIKFNSEVDFNKIPQKYQNQIIQAIPDSLRQGPLGYEVTDMKITLVDGEYHTMHTHPMDFIVATPMAIMRGLVDIGTKFLEPMLKFKIAVHEEYGTKIIGEIINMRGRFDSPKIHEKIFKIEGVYPVSTSIDFPKKLASMTKGCGNLSTNFYRYEGCDCKEAIKAEYRGINPIDRDKYILHIRGAL